MSLTKSNENKEYKLTSNGKELFSIGASDHNENETSSLKRINKNNIFNEIHKLGVNFIDINDNSEEEEILSTNEKIDITQKILISDNKQEINQSKIRHYSAKTKSPNSKQNHESLGRIYLHKTDNYKTIKNQKDENFYKSNIYNKNRLDINEVLNSLPDRIQMTGKYLTTGTNEKFETLNNLSASSVSRNIKNRSDNKDTNKDLFGGKMKKPRIKSCKNKTKKLYKQNPLNTSKLPLNKSNLYLHETFNNVQTQRNNGISIVENLFTDTNKLKNVQKIKIFESIESKDEMKNDFCSQLNKKEKLQKNYLFTDDDFYYDKI